MERQTGFLILSVNVVKLGVLVSKHSNIIGFIVGLITSVSLIGWFGYQHYENTKEDRIPIKIKQNLVNFQKQLPIKLSDEIIIEHFQLQRSSIYLVLRNTSDFVAKLPQIELVSRMNFVVCQWRHDFLGENPVTLKFKLLSADGDTLAAVENTRNTCSTISRDKPKTIGL